MVDTVNGEYKERRDRIQTALDRLGLDDPNPFGDLWTWHGKWSSGDLPSYQSRGEFISALYSPLIEQLDRGNRSRLGGVFKEPDWLDQG